MASTGTEATFLREEKMSCSRDLIQKWKKGPLLKLMN